MSQASSSGGIGFFGLLTIVFVIAKLTGYLTWSWWWVFSPIWIGWGVLLAFFLVIIVLKIVVELL